MRARTLLLIAMPALFAPGGLKAQTAPAGATPITDQLLYLLGQTSSGFQSLRGDSLGGGSWHHTYLISAGLDSATAAAGSTISELDRPHADGRPGKAIVAVFPLTTAPAGAQAPLYARYRDQITAALPTWQNRSTDGGDWTECSDPKRGREVILSNSRSAGGEMVVVLSITVHPDPTCS
jgi:hypothetical protein